MNNRLIVSLGGSIIVPDKIDVAFLKSFRKLILAQAKKGKKFLLLPGGGATARAYQQAAREVSKTTDEALDWIGIGVNRFHGQFIRWIFSPKKHAQVWDYWNVPKKMAEPIAFGTGGIKPPGSSDSCSVMFAAKLGIKTIINLTNVAAVYDRDPKRHKNAKLIPAMTWKEFRKQFGTSRKPGQHMPFDSSVSRIAEKAGIKVVILNGRDLKNLKNYLEGRKFQGTLIQS